MFLKLQIRLSKTRIANMSEKLKYEIYKYNGLVNQYNAVNSFQPLNMTFPDDKPINATPPQQPMDEKERKHQEMVDRMQKARAARKKSDGVLEL